jgi:steroid 5-alpha reductase family enzyme
MSDHNTVIFAIATVVSGALLLTSHPPFATGLAVAAAVFTMLWLLSLVLRNAGIVDVFWGPGFVVLGVFYLSTTPAPATARALLVFALATIWAIRLALHIGVRNAGAGEDFRYRAWREQAGPSFWWVSLLKVFLLQAAVLWIVSSPLALAQGEGPAAQLGALDLVGLTLFVAGFLVEAVADWQLARFKRDPDNAGRILRTGLWSRSRHPNYFGEAVLWWGLGLLSLPAGGALSLIGPALLTFSLLRVSGVAMLDAALVYRRPGYADYIRSTPAFFPRLLPKATRHR